MTESPRHLIEAWLSARLNSPAKAWLETARSDVQAGNARALSMAFSLASRKVGKDDLRLSPQDLDQARSARPGWDPSRWTLDQSARTLFVLAWPSDDPAEYVRTLDRLFAAADIGELVALYQALAVLPHPQQHTLRAAEGIRSNMKTVFEAVATRNPYPADFLDEPAWNQLVLKCLFVGTRLEPVVGIDRRANETLARMLWDYSRERRAAGRTVSPELWRCVVPFANEPMIAEVTRLLDSVDPLEQQGAALSLIQVEGDAGQRARALVAATQTTWARLSTDLDARDS